MYLWIDDLQWCWAHLKRDFQSILLLLILVAIGLASRLAPRERHRRGWSAASGQIDDIDSRTIKLRRDDSNPPIPYTTCCPPPIFRIGKTGVKEQVTGDDEANALLILSIHRGSTRGTGGNGLFRYGPAP